MDFQAHGEMRVHWLASRLVVQVSGPVNYEGARTFNQQIERAVLSNPHQNWTREEWIVHRDFLMTPDCFPCLHDSILFCRQHGCQNWCVFGANPLAAKVFADVSVACKLPVTLVEGVPRE